MEKFDKHSMAVTVLGAFVICFFLDIWMKERKLPVIPWLVACICLTYIFSWPRTREWLIRQAILLRQRLNRRMPVENDDPTVMDGIPAAVDNAHEMNDDQPSEQDMDDEAFPHWLEYEPIYALD